MNDASPDRAHARSLVVEAPDTLMDAPRTLLAERFAEYLCDISHPLLCGLPEAEIVIQITPCCLMDGFGGPGDEAVGLFALEVAPRTPNERWEIMVAYGDDYADEHDVAAWLVSIPHELLHLGEFFQQHGRLPIDVADLYSRPMRRDIEAEDRIEDEARRTVDEFVENVEVAKLIRDRQLLAGFRKQGKRCGGARGSSRTGRSEHSPFSICAQPGYIGAGVVPEERPRP